jgi:hypothetical protein
MILFKRVGESFRHIEDREWVLLFLETLGVLVGILIAFELQEWGSRRAEAAKHREIMDRLFEESEQDVGSLREIRDVLLDQSKTEVEFATQLSEGKCPPKPLWAAVGTVQMLPSLELPRSVYGELMGSGGLSSIEDARVRKSIALFNSKLSWAEGQIDYFRRFRPEVVSESDGRMRLRYDPRADEPEVEEYDEAALCSDRAFRNRMISAARNHKVFANYHDGVTYYAINMCGTLGASLGRQCEPAFGGPLKGDDVVTLKKAIGKMRRRA